MTAWANARAAALRRLAEARRGGAADPVAAAAVDAVNAHEDWVTTSSCSGRVQVLALAAPGAKQGSRVLGRWHEAPAPDVVVAALGRRPPERVAHFFAEPPILHLLARDLDAARALLLLGQRAGWKGCHLRTVAASGRVAVELGDTGRLAMPVAWPEESVAPSLVWRWTLDASALLARGTPAWAPWPLRPLVRSCCLPGADGAGECKKLRRGAN